ncbi:Asp23/Gls24 family envelope stress response protein [Thermoleophilia bacterium SCSIO 60948]|nr:Asp23/Gls24 family envelope stress response protein [Thermoleophilia bacterium SCSIO 60948]
MTDTEKDGAGKGSALATKDDSPLTSEHGRTEIADGVVAKIAGLASREVGGVHDLGGSAARKIGSVTQAVGIGDERTQGVAVEVGEKQAAVDLKIVIDYGESIPRVADSVRANIKKRIEAITGLEVTEVNIEVNDLYFPGDDEDQGASERTRVE